MVIPSTIAVKLRKTAEAAVKKNHPWVFEKSILKLPVTHHQPGSLCVLFDSKSNKPFAFGLWDPDEIIKIKIIHQGSALKLTPQYWEVKMQKALKKREGLQKITNAFRAIHGENDDFPGLVLDIYNKSGVLKLYSVIWKPYLSSIVQSLLELYSLETLVFRFSRKLLKNNPYPYQEGETIGKVAENEKVQFTEKGVQFYAYPVSGHKTGFFLDQRPNRVWVQKMASGKDVLDVFSYVGSFGVHALYGKAKTLTSIDISSHAMEVTKNHIILNRLDMARWTALVGDAFEHLINLGNKNISFDLVIIDPPAFAKQNSEVEQALIQYKRLAALGAEITKLNGFLLLASCSSRISGEALKQTHLDSFFYNRNQEWTIIKEVYHDVDHPITYSEGQYLKTIIYQRKK